MCNTPVLDRVCRESYSDPREVYAQLKRRGMTLMTLTDHNSIAGAEPLRRHADFFLSEEVTCTMPSGTEIHLGVYGISERDHAEIARRRSDLISLLVYLTERRLFFTLNHIFSTLTGRRDARDFHWFASYVPAFETRNGQMLPCQNREAEALAAQLGKVVVGGSDAHTVESAGTTYTEVPGAEDAEEFFAGLRAGRGVVRGEHGSYAKLTADVLRISREMLCENPWTALLAPLACLVPLATLGHMANEILFTRCWSARLARAGEPPRRLWQLETGPVQ
jgi:predicted metal-dependent phosphoesterase TrpH